MMKVSSLITIFAVVLGPPAVQSCDDIRLTDAWIREPPPVSKVAAGYLRMENLGRETVVIDRIESSCCARIAMHETITDGDRTRMAAIETLKLEPQDVASFVPGGAHLMLISPSTPMHHGQRLELEFFCRDGGSFRADFDVLTVR